MYNMSQFVLGLLITFSSVCSLYVFIVCLHLQKFYTSHVHICKFTVLFYHSLDNDQSTVDTYSVSPLIFIVKSVYLRNPHKILKENESLFKCKT